MALPWKKLNFFTNSDPWQAIARGAKALDALDKAAVPWQRFWQEAERWHRVLSSFSLPLTPHRKASKKQLRLTFNNKRKSILLKLSYLYGEEQGRKAFDKVEQKLITFNKVKPRKLKYHDAAFNPLNRFTEKDIILVTYPDSLQDTQPPLRVLREFAQKRLKSINTIHLLPFYPYTTDRGFSVVNYKKVNKRFGTWADITELSKSFNIMFDGVFNHISAKSRWFQQFLRGNPLYEDHFISFDTKDALSADDRKRLFRPRASDVLVPCKTKHSTKYVWSTFGEDQMDLNYKEPRVLLRFIDVLLMYVRHGASIIRLDAIAYIWKEKGTSSVHLRQTHTIVQLLRDIFDIAAPSVSLITETNVPHAQNIRYFGNGRNEAQMVYNFALPPLVLYTFYSGNARYISRWADRLERVSPYCTYFNFLASHDGIGLTPAQRILPQREVKFLIKKAKQHGSLVLNKAKGQKLVPYELNITWWNAINDDNTDEDEGLKIQRYLASRAIALVLKGVPGIYIHSLFATKNDSEAVTKSKVSRDINRRNLDIRQLRKELRTATCTRKVFERLTDLLRIRSAHKAFHPSSEQKMIMQSDGVFSLLRVSIDNTERMLVLVNVTAQEQSFTVNCSELGLGSLYDCINRRHLALRTDNITVREFDIALKPYDIMWLRYTQ